MVPESERLDTWKEIADYLGRGVSTVRRWEREEGLPVRRQEHLKRGSVVAYKAELDAWLNSRTTSLPDVAPEPDGVVETAPEPEAVSGSENLKGRRALIAAAMAIPAVTAAWTVWKRPHPVVIRRLTAAREPSISADGSRVALARGRQMSILDVASGKERLVCDADAPKWSRDGKWLAYAKKATGAYWIAICDARGGNERVVRERIGPFFDWMPDGQSLVVAHRTEPDEPIGAYSLRLSDGHLRRLTHPPAGTWGDVMVAVSFQGDRLALARYRDRGKGDIYVAKMDGSELVRLTWQENWINGLTFTPDDSEIVFSGQTERYGGLLRVPVHGGEVRPVSGVPEGAQWPSFAALRPGLFCFHERHWESPLLVRAVHGTEEPRRLFAEMNIEAVQASRDGKWLAGIRSQRGLYLFAMDGSAHRVLVESSIAGLASFSPDSRWVAFASKRGERHAVQIVPVEGGAPQPLTAEIYNEGRPQWSADGRSIYFYSDREGVPGIYRSRWPASGSLELIFRRGVEARESPDGKWIYLLPHEQDGNLLVGPAAGGAFRPVRGMPKVEPGHWGCIRDGIYFCHAAPDHSTRMGFLPYGADDPVALPASPVNQIGTEHLLGFALDWTGKRMFWCHGRTPTSIYLAEGFSS